MVLNYLPDGEISSEDATGEGFAQHAREDDLAELTGKWHFSPYAGFWLSTEDSRNPVGLLVLPMPSGTDQNSVTSGLVAQPGGRL